MAELSYYIAQFFTPRLNFVRPPYNSLVMHNSYLDILAHIWNHLADVAKSSTTLKQFRVAWTLLNLQGASVWRVYSFIYFFHFYSRLNGVEFAGCQCMNCIFQLKLLILGLDIVILSNNKQLLDEGEHDIMNYQNRGLCYLICFWGEHSKGLSNQADVELDMINAISAADIAFIMSSSQAIVNWLNALDQSDFS